MTNKGAQVVGIPAVISLCDYAGKFAVSARFVCQAFHSVSPLRESILTCTLITYLRFQAMIIHNPHLGIPLGDGQKIIDVLWKSESIKSQPQITNRLKAPLHIIPQHPVHIRNILYHRPNTQ